MEEITKRGMLTVIHMFKSDDNKDNEEKENACGSDKDKEDKKNTDVVGNLFSAASGVNYNKDGTIPVDIFRTGVWRHPWYGAVSITEEYLDSVMKNYENKVIGRQVSFDYHHEHRMNYGVPVKLRKEERQGIFVSKPFTMLVADVRLTSQGKTDTESGQVLNFSSEVSDDYVHNEMLPVVYVDENGEVVLDNDGNIVEKYIAKRFGPTLLGGAVTNHPFITELNPNGLGGNLEAFKMSIDGGLMVANPSKLNNDNIASMCFSTDSDIDRKNDQATALNDLKYEAAIDAAIFDELLNDGNSYVMVGDCFYDASEYKAGDAALPDAAYTVVYEVRGKSGKMLKVRKLPHHTSGVKSADDNSSLDIPRLKNALSRLNQTDAPAAKVKAAGSHLNTHADASYRKPQKHSTDVENNRMPEADKPVVPVVPEVKSFSMDDVKTLVESKVGEALSKQREELEKKFATDTNNLKAHVEAEQAKSYSLEVDSFVSKIADGKATPAFQKVARFGLIGNKNMTIRYFNDTEKKYEDISLQDFVNKIAATADFDNVGTGETVVETTAEGVVKKHTKPVKDARIFSAEDVKAMSADPVKFAAFMKEHSGSLLVLNLLLPLSSSRNIDN